MRRTSVRVMKILRRLVESIGELVTAELWITRRPLRVRLHVTRWEDR